MKTLLIVLSFVGFSTFATADEILVSCTNGTGTVTVYNATNFGLAAEVNTGTEIFRYAVEEVPPMLPGDYYASLFDSLRYSAIGNDEFSLQLCANKSCSRDQQGRRAGAAKFHRPGTTGLFAPDRFEFETMACQF